ncbi:MAG: hypothetical protein LC119_15140 [Burkholderiales bacterium]|nr:hypothetical protein [Burkholderiales bacterium]
MPRVILAIAAHRLRVAVLDALRPGLVDADAAERATQEHLLRYEAEITTIREYWDGWLTARGVRPPWGQA